MNIFTTSLLALSAAASVASAQSQNPDLVFNQLHIERVEYVGPYFEIAFSYEILNIGNLAIDFEGPDPFTDLDNVYIQTYLTSNPDFSEPVFAAGGTILPNPVVLAPGESYKGIYVSNTNQYLDPSVLDMDTWLVIDVMTDTIPGEPTENNRAFIQIPSPGSATLLGFSALAVCVRRRR